MNHSSPSSAVAAPSRPTKKPFKILFCADRGVLKIPSAALKVWLCHYFHEGKKNISWPSVPTICAETGMGEAQVYRGRKWLLDNGWMRKVGEIPALHGGRKVPQMTCLTTGNFPVDADFDGLPETLAPVASDSNLSRTLDDLSENTFNLSLANGCDLSNQGYEVDTEKVDIEVNIKEVDDFQTSHLYISKEDKIDSPGGQDGSSESETICSARDRVQNTQAEIAPAHAATNDAILIEPVGVFDTQGGQPTVLTTPASESSKNKQEWCYPSARVTTYADAYKALKPEQCRLLDTYVNAFSNAQMVSASMDWIASHAPEALTNGIDLAEIKEEVALDPYRNLNPEQITEIKRMEAAQIAPKDIVWRKLEFWSANRGKKLPSHSVPPDSAALPLVIPTKPIAQDVPKSRFHRMEDHQLSALLEEEFMFDLNHKYQFTAQRPKKREAMIRELEAREMGPSSEAQYFALHRGPSAARAS
jgi:hypothetical protein